MFEVKKKSGRRVKNKERAKSFEYCEQGQGRDTLLLYI